MRQILLFVFCAATFARAQVPAGTPIRLMLLKEISSSTSMPGDLVPLVVTHDIEVDGKVLIAEGTMAFAKVSWSRREGALSAAIFDKPARLCLTLDHLKDLDGHEINLSPQPGKHTDLSITREMTAKVSDKDPTEYASSWRTSSTRPPMAKVHDLFTDTANSMTEKEAEVLIQHNVQMPFVQEAIRTGTFGLTVNFIRDIKHGHAFEVLLSLSPATRPALMAIRAFREFGKVSSGVRNYISGRFKGRNIKGAVGVELTVYAG
jgi:hypothetical protein